MLNFLIFIIILSILIIAHELGHFFVARKSGVKVERFSVGFGPALLKLKGKETDFFLCLIPLGGYVKLAGDSRAESRGLANEFLAKPAGIKMKIVFAGPFFNYLLAFILFWAIALVGFPSPAPVVGKVLDNYPAKEAGIRAGDKVLAVNGRRVEYWFQMAEIIHESKEKVSLKIERQGRVISLSVPLKAKEASDEFGRKKSVSLIGISPSSKTIAVRYNFFSGLIKAGGDLARLTFLIVKGFVLMILGVVPFKEAVGGPFYIYYITSEAAKVGILALVHLMAILNLSLAIVNLLPLPVLDGGHLLIFSLEKIRKRQLSERVEIFLTRLGLIVIGILVVFVLCNDIRRLSPKLWNKTADQRPKTEDQLKK